MDLNVISQGARSERRGLRRYLAVSIERLEEKEKSVYVSVWKRRLAPDEDVIFLFKRLRIL